ncbi:MAG: VCBS repeat-containing protein [Pirellulales bacterium]|nr:VCBS repeat-containing protein [Pirellulales bacterium]
MISPTVRQLFTLPANPPVPTRDDFINRFAVVVILIAIIACSIGSASAKETSKGKPAGCFPPDQSIPVASSLHGGQIGRSDDPHALHSAIPLGTADVFGNGPYDLFVTPNRLFPFEKFDKEGTPLYGKPRSTGGERINDIFCGSDGTIYGIKAIGRKVRICKFNKDKLTFEKCADSDELDIGGSLGSGMAAYVGPNGKLHVYSTISDDTVYRPPGDHHSASFMPYDGAGFWRGGIPRRILVHACFSSLDLKRVESAGRVGDGPGEFLFSVRSMTVVNLGAKRPPALVSSEKQGVLRYFTIDKSTGSLGPQLFVDDEQRVALRHPAINPSAKAIPDQKTGLSNLIVGEGGRLWFYRFSGKFADNGSPIYQTPAKPVLAEGAPLTLANLPVISPGDLDGDGLIDLIVGNNAGDLLFVKNVGKPARPEFDNPAFVPVGGRRLDIKSGYRGSIQGPGEAMWGYTCPTLCDWDGDGRLDVILNSALADYMFLQGLPSKDGPAFSEPKLMYCDGLQLHLAWRSQPAVTDWGTGKRLCMIALDEKNLLRRFWRVDNQNVERGELLLLQDGSPITANADEAAGQTGRAKLVAHDWDKDGDIDLLIGTSRGLSFPASKDTYLPSGYGLTRKASVLLLRNVGSNAKPVFDYVKQVEFNGERIKLGTHSCSPAPVDLGRGVIDLLVGEEAGTIHYYPAEALSVSGLGK